MVLARTTALKLQAVDTKKKKKKSFQKFISMIKLEAMNPEYGY